MNNQTNPRVISLSAELARTEDDERRRKAQRWSAAVHRLALLRATNNGTTYETEWLRIFDKEQLLTDLHHASRLLAVAALDVMEVQHEQTLIGCDIDKIPYDRDAMDQFSELLIAMRMHLSNEC